MLRWFSIPRFAPQSSPEKERRLLQFSGGAPSGGHSADAHDAHGADHGHEGEHGDGHGAEHGHEAGHHDAVGHGQKHAHGAIKYVLTNKSTAERISHTEGKIQSVVGNLQKIQEIASKKIHKDDQAKHLDAISSNTFFLEDTLTTMDSWKRLTEIIEEWESGKMEPGRFFYHVQQYMAKDDKKMVSTALEHFFAVHPEAQNWDSLNTGTKVGMTRQTAKDLLKYMQEYMEKLDEELEKQEQYCKDLKRARDNFEKAGNADEGMGVEFFSIYQVLESATNVVEAFQNAYKEWSQLKVASLSNTFGKLVKHLPGGDSAQQTLAASLEHKNDEVRKHYAEHLEADLVPFWEMIPSHHGQGFLERNKGNANRFIGSLDYMAKKGWLYELDADNRIVMGHKLIRGKTVPADWTDVRIKQYIDELYSKNQSGQKSETDRGRDRVDYAASIADGMKVLREEMHDGNYWAIRGILNRLLEKAKIGHAAAWLASSIMRELRSDPVARRYFPIELLDRIGNEGLQHLAGTNFYWVADRFKISNWGKSTWFDDKLAEERLEQSGTIGKLTHQIEQEIREVEHASHVSKPLKPPELDEVVARVMATQVVKLDGWNKPISLFSDKYTWYRQGFKKTDGTTVKPDTTDDDFMREDSEVVLHGPQIAGTIVKVQSPDNLAYDAKAKAYLGQLIRRDRQLGEAGLTKEQENFRKENRETFKAIFTQYWTAPAVTRFVDITHADGDIDGYPVLIAMAKRNMIDMEHLSTAPYELAKALCKKMGVTHASAASGATPAKKSKTNDDADAATPQYSSKA